MKLLLENEGIREDIKNGFITYLLSHPRPFHEVLKPTPINQKSVFIHQFVGMTDIKFDYDDFEKVRISLISKMSQSLSNSDKDFLISFSLGDPQWEIAAISKMKELSAVKWKLLNIKKMSEKKRKDMTQMLRASF